MSKLREPSRDSVPDLIVACALRQETEALRKGLNRNLEVITTGLGTDRTARSLADLYQARRPRVLVFTGMAGQLDPTLQVGDFVFPAAWALESGTRFESDQELVAALRAAGWAVDGLGLTVRRPVVKEKHRLQLFRETGARICDMESAAALMVSRSFGVRCLSAKVVSDTADSGMLSFFRNFDRNIASLANHLGPLVDWLAASLTTDPAGTL